MIYAWFGNIINTVTFFANSYIQQGANAAKGSGQITDVFGATGLFATLSNTLLYLVGALAVIMLIFGGFRYVVSGGNQAAVTGAKNTILYAIVGIIVAIFAYAVINFVIVSFSSDGGYGATNV